VTKRPGRSGALAWLLVSALGAASVLPAVSAVGNESVELHVQAAYILHFVRYVYWPRPSLVDASSPLVVGVFGHDPMVDALERAVSGKAVDGRSIRVKLISSTEQIDRCDILFVPKSESRQMPTILTAVSGRPILMVSDKEKFSSEGGMIEFVLIDDTVRFIINRAAAEKAGLKLSSELLRVAYAVTGRRQ
jgi:hypothetical protein